MFFQIYIKNPSFEQLQTVPWTDEMTHVISTAAGINGVSYLLSQQGDLLFRSFRDKH